MQEQKLLLEQLEQYHKTDMYPFHMPGHKRQEELGITQFPNPFSVDITEIEGFDNLHHPEGILKDSMDQAAHIYRADQTRYLVNGSTAGILSAISASVKRNGCFLMARNSHKSAYHAAFLKNLSPVYVFPEFVEQYGIQGKIQPEAVERILKERPEIEAVFITSPTYEGIVSEVKEIAEVVHRYGIPLIVDEAHGAHLPFADGELFPKPALDCGADIVIQSLHKTLPSLTQTAVLHMKGKLADREKVDQYLRIYQSSSPSYVLLSSIENCIHYMNSEGRDRLLDYGTELKVWLKDCAGLSHLKLMTGDTGGVEVLKNRDISKILVSVKGTSLTGVELTEILRNRYHLEPEMCCQSYVLFMTSLMDTKDGLERLKTALYEIDRELEKCESPGEKTDYLTWIRKPKVERSIAEASEVISEKVKLQTASDRISTEFITVYPPGIPAVVPGEVITEEVILLMEYYMAAGLTVEGISDDGSVGVIAGK